MLKKLLHRYTLIVISSLFIGAIFWIFIGKNTPGESQSIRVLPVFGGYSCVQVEGDSLSGILAPWSYLWVGILGSTSRNLLKSGDLVTLKSAQKWWFLVKQIRGVPWDHLSIPEAQGRDFILQINGSTLLDVEGIPLKFPINKRALFDLYLGIIPPKSYLVLGNLQGGTYDSSRFGLISDQEIESFALEQSIDDTFCKFKKTGSR